MADKADARAGDALRKDSFGVGVLIFTIIAAVGPMSAFMGATPLVFAMTGGAAPGVYLLSALVLAVFTVGYTAMSRRLRSASGFIAFIDRAFGRPAGLAAGYVTLVAYLLFLAGLYALFSVFLKDMVLRLTGIDMHWLLGFAIFLPAILFMSYRRIELSVAVIGPLVVLGAAAILLLDLAILAGAPPDSLSFSGLAPSALVSPALGVAMLIGVGSFAGVESAAVFSEEVRNPRRAIPVAMYVSIALLGLFYVGSTLLVSNAIGLDAIQEAARTNPTGFIFDLGRHYLGDLWAEIAGVLAVASIFAVLLGFSNMIHRYVFALGRAGVLPRFLGRTHPELGSPHLAGFATGAATALPIVALAAFGADAYGKIYTWCVAIGTFGMLSLMCFASLAVVADSRRSGAGDDGVLASVIAPFAAFLVFGALLVVALVNFDSLAGPGSVERSLWLVVAIAAVIGWIIGKRPSLTNINLADPT